MYPPVAPESILRTFPPHHNFILSLPPTRLPHQRRNETFQNINFENWIWKDKMLNKYWIWYEHLTKYFTFNSKSFAGCRLRISSSSLHWKSVLLLLPCSCLSYQWEGWRGWAWPTCTCPASCGPPGGLPGSSLHLQ